MKSPLVKFIPQNDIGGPVIPSDRFKKIIYR